MLFRYTENPPENPIFTPAALRFQPWCPPIRKTVGFGTRGSMRLSTITLPPFFPTRN